MSWSERTRTRLVAGLIAAFVGLSGCGFEPLYSPRAQTSAVAETSLVGIASLPDRTGQLLRNELVDRLNPNGEPDRPRYHLGLSIAARREGLAFQRDLTVTRYKFVLSTSYVLNDSVSGTTILRGQARAVAAYNVVQSEFANVVAERDAEARAAREVGEEVALRIAVFLGGRGQGSSPK